MILFLSGIGSGGQPVYNALCITYFDHYAAKFTGALATRIQKIDSAHEGRLLVELEFQAAAVLCPQKNAASRIHNGMAPYHLIEPLECFPIPAVSHYHATIPLHVFLNLNFEQV